MKLSTRSRYGLRALLELAIGYGKGPLQIKTIAKSQEISNKYLEQLIAILKSAGLVRSIRGPKGGYILSKSPEEISLKDIFTVLEGPLAAVDCIDHPEQCSRCADCITRNIWMQMHEAMLAVLESKTLATLVAQVKDDQTNTNYQI